MSREDELDRLVGDAEKVREAYEVVPTCLGALEGPQHILTACNAAFRAFHPRAVRGLPISEFAPELRGQGAMTMWDRVYETGEPFSVSNFRVQVDLDGTGIRESFLNITAVPQRAADGTITGSSFVLTDTTEQVRARVAAEQRAHEMTGRFESMRESATLMQRALLSPYVPVLPGAELAAAYLVATQDTAAGGDWFDALNDPAGHLVLVLGDVVGHGVQAAAVMAQLRTAVRMQLSAGAGITEALEAVDRFSSEVPGAKSATLCVARLDTVTGEFEYCTAGHPPPLVIGAEGTGYYLEPTGAGPLASGYGFATKSSTLAVGDVALLYSDGIIERPGREVRASSVEFADVSTRVLRREVFPLDSAQPAVQRLCAQAVEIMVRTTGYSDDVTLLAAQRRTPPPSLHVDLPAKVTSESTFRVRLLDWLMMVGADAANMRPLVHAVNEFVANAIEHAYLATPPANVTLDAVLGGDGRVRVTVTDVGTWKPPSSGRTNRGRGLPIAHSLIPDTVVNHGPGGTTVTATHRLTRAAHIVTDIRIAPGTPHAPTSTTFDMDVSEDGDILVLGDVDTLAAPALAAVLSSRSQGGTSPIRVNLSAATHLGSAAVSVLAEACARAERQNNTCTLVAAPGGVAHHVLSLVGLPTVYERVST